MIHPLSSSCQWLGYHSEMREKLKNYKSVEINYTLEASPFLDFTGLLDFC